MRIRLQLDAELLMLMSLVAVVMPNAEDDGAQQHARNEENELPEAVSPCPAVPEDLGQQGMKRDEEKGGGGGGKRKGDSGDGYGNGFTFANYNAHELYEACWRAKEGYWQKDGWPVLVKRAMECDFSWSNSAQSYEGLYNEVVNLW